MILLYTFSLISLVISTIICSRTDPSDQAMILFRNHTKQEYNQLDADSKIIEAKRSKNFYIVTIVIALSKRSLGIAKFVIGTFYSI